MRMRSAWITGPVLAAGGFVLLWLGQAFDLRISSTLLLGLALGGALALVPGAGDLAKLGGAAVGVLAAVVGYALRALELPDSTGGLAVALVVVIAVCTVAAGASRGRLPLWAALLGAGAFVGLYEAPYAAAPPEMATTVLTALTNALLVLGAGYLLASATQSRSFPGTPAAAPAPATTADQTMETI